MSFIQWCLTNWQGVLSIISCVLGAAILIAHLAHADAAASSMQNIEDVINKLNSPQPPAK